MSSEAERNKKNRFGYLDKRGLFVLPASFVRAGNFFQGVALVETTEERNCAGINSNGEILWQVKARGICLSANDFRARVKEAAGASTQGDKAFLFNRVIEEAGRKILQIIDSAGRLIWQNVSVEEPSSAVDLATYVAALEAAERAESNKYELAVEKFTGNCGEYGLHPKLSPLPRLLCGPRYRTGLFSDGLAYLDFREKNGTKKLYITESGELGLMLPKEIVAVGNFSDGLAPACVLSDKPPYRNISARLGFIDKNGHFVIEPEYSPEYDVLGEIRFQEGICTLRKGNKMGAINKKGEEVVPFKYSSMSGYYEGLCAAFVD